MVKGLLIFMAAVTALILAIFFYAAIYSPIEMTPQLVREVESEAVSGEPEEDPLLFAFIRNDPVEFNSFLLKGEGLKSGAVMDEQLKKGEFVALLSELWSERDDKKRLLWLREKEGGSYPLLLFELAVEVGKNRPTVEGVEEAITLLELGKMRTELDALCTNNSSAATAAGTLYKTYARAVANGVSGDPALLKELLEAPKEPLSRRVNKRLYEALVVMQKNLDSLPPPDWISGRTPLLPKEACREKQKRLLNLYIEEAKVKMGRG